jgi:microcystin-dependent protein
MAAAGTVTSSNTDVPSDKVGLGVTTGLTSSGGAITVNLYLSDPNPTAILNGGVVSPITTGNGGKPHENRMPSLALNVCICLMGLYPQRN